MADDVWTIHRALAWTEDYLTRKGDAHPRLSAQWLMQDATKLSRIDLFTHFEQPLSIAERDVLRDYVRRRGAGEPLQYITGSVAFRFLTMKVRPGVLIPRPETEILVGEALKLLPKRHTPCSALGEHDVPTPQNADVAGISDENDGAIETRANDIQNAPSSETLYVLDACTGSGCIACSLAHEHPDVRVIATDIAPEAIALAQENVDDLGLNERVHLCTCDLAAGVDPALLGSFTLIVSNPPYVPRAVLQQMDREVTDYEPVLALDGGPDGLDIFRRLVSFSRIALKPGGALIVELHETCLDEAKEIAVCAGLVSCRIIKDLAHKPRILIAQREPQD